MARSPEATTIGASSRRALSWRAAGIVVVALLAVAGSGLILLGHIGAPERVRPPAPVAVSPGESSPPPARTASLTRSEPVEIRIRRINLRAPVVDVGLDANGAIEVPPLERPEIAGWYELGPSPGEIGNAVIVGHVDSYKTGPAVFFHLGSLRPGDVIEVARKDGSVATFRIDDVASYPKTDFPTTLVYGPSDTAGLRLVTCGGAFDDSARSYLDNVIVFATLASSRPPSPAQTPSQSPAPE